MRHASLASTTSTARRTTSAPRSCAPRCGSYSKRPARPPRRKTSRLPTRASRLRVAKAPTASCMLPVRSRQAIRTHTQKRSENRMTES
eukprot:scaffold16644_cov59-Phaeocystis_antarctica.AAC.3